MEKERREREAREATERDAREKERVARIRQLREAEFKAIAPKPGQASKVCVLGILDTSSGKLGHDPYVYYFVGK